jgi:hypothetical protein
MIMKSIWRAFLGLLVAVATCGADSASAKPTLVEFWHTGDDGLSQRLAETVETAFKRSPDFVLSSGKKPGTLVVTIPTNVDWKQVSKRTRVLYRVEFASVDNQTTSKATGSCWDDNLQECAAQILRNAKIATHTVR